jgi:ketosteroid isomerase-like protein
MSNRLIVAAAALVGFCGWALARQGAPAPAKSEPDPKRALMDADRAFARATAEKGLDGWMGFMADDAVRVRPLGGKAYVGKDAVRKLDAPLFADPNRRLVWDPTDGGAFADGNHGFTTGRARLLARSADGKDDVAWSGAYVTWWRKDRDSRWKVILDTGADDPPKK